MSNKSDIVSVWVLGIAGVVLFVTISIFIAYQVEHTLENEGYTTNPVKTSRKDTR